MKQIVYVSLMILSISFPTMALAQQQINGQIWVGSTGSPAANATVLVTCGSFEEPDIVDSSGRYKITGLPDNMECKLVVTHGKTSLPLRFRVHTSDVRKNLELSPWKDNKWLLQVR